MTGSGFPPIPGCFDKAAAHDLLPETVGHDLGEAFVLWCGDECREEVAGVGWVFRELMADVGVDELFEGPGWRDLGSGLESDFD